ncbi:MAG: DNA internalization-related competence protein ComEC/Rec2 [Acidobacteriota bacterium]
MAACVWAPRVDPSARRGGLPVRFVATVRDGWTEGAYGWQNRVRLERVEAGPEVLRTVREVRVLVGGAGSPLALPEAGTRIEGTGEFVTRGRFPLERPSLRVKSPALVRQVEGRAVIDRWRQKGVELLERSAGVDARRLRAAGLAAALCLGRTEGLRRGEIQDLRRSGLAHLLAVSGMNVGLVAVMGWWVMQAVGLAPRTRRWLLIPVVLTFGLLAGWDAPVRRAALGAAAYLGGRQFGRPLRALPVVWGVVAGLVLAEPAALHDASLVLSAGITLALVRWTVPVAEALRLLPASARTEAAAVVVAQASSSPLVGGLFGAVAPLGMIVNTLAAPLSFLLLAPALGATAMAGTGAAGWLLEALGWVQTVLDGLAEWAGQTVWTVPPPPIWMAVAFLVVAVAALSPWRRAGFAALTVCAGAVAWTVLPARAGSAPTVRLLRVGEGMALLVRDGQSAVLFDGGRSEWEAARDLARLRVRRLDALVVTHPDADHVGGAPMVLERLEVRRLVFPVLTGDSPAIVALRRQARRFGVEEVGASAGVRLDLRGVELEILWPPGAARLADNDASLVALAKVGGMRVLVTGDIESGAETALASGTAALGADVLQLAHHGSRTSSTAQFLESVRPSLALAVSGIRPRWRYPHVEVMRRIRASGAVILAQSEGFEEVRWNVEGGLTVVGSEPVKVGVRTGIPRE